MAETIIYRGFLDFVDFVRTLYKGKIDLFYLFILFPDYINALYDKTDRMTKSRKWRK